MNTYKFKILLFISCSLLALAILFGLPVLWWARGGYYVEVNAVKAEFKQLPNVEVAEITWVDDITLEQIRARILIKGKGEMELCSLISDSFHKTRHLLLASVGNYKVFFEEDGDVGVVESATGKPVRSQAFGGVIDIGTDGEFAQFFPFEISNVQTAVDKYDDICRIVSSWPAKPEKKHFKDAKGNDFYYYVEKEEPLR